MDDDTGLTGLLLLLCFTRPHPFSSAAVVGNLICNAIAGLTRTLRENADDAEVVPPAASHRIALHGLTIFWRDIVSMSAAGVRASGRCPFSVAACRPAVRA